MTYVGITLPHRFNVRPTPTRNGVTIEPEDAEFGAFNLNVHGTDVDDLVRLLVPHCSDACKADLARHLAALTADDDLPVTADMDG